MPVGWRDFHHTASESEEPTPFADSLVQLEIHYVADTQVEFFIDGLLAWTFVPDQTGNATGLVVGQRDAVAGALGAIVYVDDVAVGTTQGASDIFADDFSSGDFSNWDSTVGDVSVVASPPPPGATGNVMVADVSSVANSYALKMIAGDESEVWFTINLAFTPEALDSWGAGLDDYSGEFIDVLTTTGSIPSTIAAAPALSFSEDDGPPLVYEEPLWRFVVTDLDLAIITILTPLAANRRATFTLNAPAMATGIVPSDSPEVNILQAGHPFLDEGRRCLLGFRREGGSPPWIIRYAGILEQIEDAIDENGQPTAHSTYTAWDPWKYLYSRPVLRADGTLPAQAGVVFEDMPANEIATTLLDRTLTYDGEHHIKTGNIQTCDVIDTMTFQQGTSVGEAWTQLCETNKMDVYLRPIYDPVVSPGKLVALDIHPVQGRTRYKSVFSWDMPMRSLSGISRLVDGTLRANKIQYYVSQGGPGNPHIPTQSDFASVAQYGNYWLQKFVPGGTKRIVIDLAEAELLLLKDGLRTYRVRPLAEPSPRPFIDYTLGDHCPLLASANLREGITGVTQRVYEIPIEIDDDGIERVQELTFTEDSIE